MKALHAQDRVESWSRFHCSLDLAQIPAIAGKATFTPLTPPLQFQFPGRGGRRGSSPRKSGRAENPWRGSVLVPKRPCGLPCSGEQSQAKCCNGDGRGTKSAEPQRQTRIVAGHRSPVPEADVAGDSRLDAVMMALRFVQRGRDVYTLYTPVDQPHLRCSWLFICGITLVRSSIFTQDSLH